MGRRGCWIRESHPATATSNENANGLLRHYLPKTADLRRISRPTWTTSPPSSTAALDRSSASRHPHAYWRRRCADPLRPPGLLRQPPLPRHRGRERCPEPVSEINVAQPALSQGSATVPGMGHLLGYAGDQVTAVLAGGGLLEQELGRHERSEGLSLPCSACIRLPSSDRKPPRPRPCLPLTDEQPFAPQHASTRSLSVLLRPQIVMKRDDVGRGDVRLGCWRIAGRLARH